ncbi:MAG: hypothetical protein IKN43_04920, partial [Selenomonadaceae bacterium]|nr:hypothetical protein [Selenomonadaceae bacterium]
MDNFILYAKTAALRGAKFLREYKRILIMYLKSIDVEGFDMAIKERLLKRLFTINDRLEQATDVSERTTKNFLLQQLTDVRDKCQDGLPKGFYGEYAKIYDGLILAVKQIVNTESQGEREEIRTLISEVLQNLILQTNNEERFKKEMVFLPYKFSMWDSLESVWRAAYEDSEHCKAYVIPIPYAEIDSDGNVVEWRCERGHFPKDIPTLNWQEVDLKEMRPDVIFIHNPYDQLNSVTSVESRYFSYNLKPCTDCLVYIPYYATSGNMAESQSMCSAYKHVDYIVIQSEKFRKFFDASLPDEKFLPFGSPKFDKTIRLCANPPKPPAKWEKKMRGKKVFFYNTSIGGLLDDTPNFLKKMRYVFDTFKKRKNICLIWRPHPLLEATLRSMRPDYKKKFEKLRDSFIREDIGIYDTTPDIEKTIALCDAYIGDGATSVISLFGVAGKPAFYL